MENHEIEKKLIIDLISYILFKSDLNCDLYKDVKLDYPYILKKLREHKLENIAFYALNELKIEQVLFEKLKMIYVSHLSPILNQQNEYKNIIKLFDENNIDYVPLKGIKVKDYYPYEDMRLMGDIDILIPYKKRLEVRKLLINKGYQFEKSSAKSGHHEIFNANAYVNFEIHFALFDDNDNYLDDNVWKETNNHQTSKEFELTFLLAHYYKHFYHGGASFKPMLDIALLINKYKLDQDKLQTLLKESGYYKFYCNVVQIINYLFKQNNYVYESFLNEQEILEIIDYIFVCGDFGFGEENDYQKNTVMNNLSGKKVNFFTKIGYLIKQVCIPYRIFKNISKVIKYCPILLPFGWIVRFFRYLFRHNPKEIKQRVNSVSDVSNEDIKQYQTINKFLQTKEERK